MNRRQKITLIVWAAIMVAQLFYPPFQSTDGHIHYGAIGNLMQGLDNDGRVLMGSINVLFLFAQWVATSVVAAVCYLLLGPDK
jgi:hypothetical protein